MYHSFVIHSSAVGHLGCFHVLLLLLLSRFSRVRLCATPLTASYQAPLSLGFSRQTSTNNKCCRGCGEKGTLLHCQWGYKLVQPLWRTVWRFLKKTGTRTAIQPRNPTAGHTHRGNQSQKRHMYPNIHCSTVALAQTRKQPRYPSADKWIRKLWYIHRMKYYSAIKKNAFESVLVRWLKLEPIIQSEVS